MLDALRPASWTDKLASLRTRRAAVESDLERIDAQRRPLMVDASLGDKAADATLRRLDDEHRQARRSRDIVAQAEAQAAEALALEQATAHAAERARRIRALDKLHRDRLDAVRDVEVAYRDLAKALHRVFDTGAAIVADHRSLVGQRSAVADELREAAVVARLMEFAVATDPAVATALRWSAPFSAALPDLAGAERAIQSALKVTP